jgi:dolichyl-phosphate beta-glucosyltransferase
LTTPETTTKKLSLVIPAYNEQNTILRTVQEAREFCAEHFADAEIIVVNDGSTDKTEEILAGQSLARVISYPENRGKGCAVRTGILAAAGDIVCFTDADLAYGLSPLLRAVPLLAEYDAVVGSRRLSAEGYGEYTPLRKLMSRVFHFMTRVFSGLKYDSQCGFKCFSREAARDVFTLTQTDGFAADFEIMLLADKLGLRVAELPVSIIRHGNSSVSVVRDSLRVFADLRRIRARLKRVAAPEKTPNE